MRSPVWAIYPLFWLELAGVGYGEILADTVWDTLGVFWGHFGSILKRLKSAQMLVGRGFSDGAGGRN